MAGDPTLGTWMPDVYFDNGVGGAFTAASQAPNLTYTRAMAPTQQQQMVTTPYPYGAFSGFQDPTSGMQTPYQPRMGNFIQSDGLAARGVTQYGGAPAQQPLTNPTGAGGDYNDSFNAPYESPYGDLSGVPVSSIDTSYQNPTTAYRMPTSGSTFGDLSGSQNVATGGATLAGYQPQPTYASPAGGADLSSGNPFARQATVYGGMNNSAATGGATLGGATMPGVNSAYGDIRGAGVTNPTPTYPQGDFAATRANPVGGAAIEPRDAYGFGFEDQTYMDIPQGPNGIYGNLMGGDDSDYMDIEPARGGDGVLIQSPQYQPNISTTSYQSPGGAGAQMPGTSSPYGAPAVTRAATIFNGQAAPQQPAQQKDAYLFPNTPLMSPTVVYPDGGRRLEQPGPMPAQQYFQQNMQAEAPSDYQPAFGGMPQFTPMPSSTGTTKITDRAPQMGGFVSYAAPQLPPVSTPSSPPATGLQAITNALTGGRAATIYK